MKKKLLVIALLLLPIVVAFFVHSYIKDRQNYVTVDAVKFIRQIPSSYRATVHSPETTYQITCTDRENQDGTVRPCRMLGVHEVIKFGTMGDMMTFFDGGNFNSWKIESEAAR